MESLKDSSAIRNLLNNIFSALGPDKGFGVLIVVANVFLYGSHQFGNTLKDSPASPLAPGTGNGRSELRLADGHIDEGPPIP